MKASPSRPTKQRIAALPGLYAVARLDPAGVPPQWAMEGGFWSVTRASDELSLVCEAARIPEGCTVDGGWRLLKLEGPLPLNATGILVSVLEPLARAGVSALALGTFVTDYVLVKDGDLARAAEALEIAGHHVERRPRRGRRA